MLSKGFFPSLCVGIPNQSFRVHACSTFPSNTILRVFSYISALTSLIVLIHTHSFLNQCVLNIVGYIKKVLKSVLPGIRNLPSSWSGEFKRHLKIIGYFYCPGLNLKVRPYCWRQHTLQTQDLRNWAGIDLKASSLKTSSHGIGQYYANYQRGKGITVTKHL